MAGAQNILQELQLLCTPLLHLIGGSSAYKLQLLESMEAAKVRYQKNRIKDIANIDKWKDGQDAEPSHKVSEKTKLYKQELHGSKRSQN